MKLTWLGHSCFAVEQDGYRIILDPYRDVAGHADICAEAHAVLCSHDHFDHGAVECVAILPERECPFAIRTVETCHDEEGGALRGPNTIHVLAAGGVTVAHLGDLGHQLTVEQLAALGKVDGVLIPIGGTYTVTAEGAKQVCEAIAPKWIVPMHYHHGTYGFPVLTGLEDFTKLWAEEAQFVANSFSVDADTAGILVPEFA